MSKFEICVSVEDLAQFFKVSEDYVRSQAQYEVMKVKGDLEVISKETYPRLSKVLFSQAPSLCVYTLESVTGVLKSIYDKREFIDKFLDSEPKSIVKDLFTGVLYYWSDSIISEYYQFVKDLQKQLLFTLEKVALDFDLEPVQLYSLIRYLDLRLVPLVGSKTQRKVYILPSVTYATICAYLTQNQLVDLTLTERGRLTSMGVKPEYVKSAGTFLNKTVLDYLRSSNSQGSVEIEGKFYVPYTTFLAQLGLKPMDISSGLKTLLVDTSVSEGEFVSYDFVREVDTYKQNNAALDIRLCLLCCLDLLDKDTALTLISSYEFRGYYNQILSRKFVPLSKSSYKYVAENSKPLVCQQLQLPFYSKELFLQTLRVVVRGLPLDTTYTGYLSVYRLAEFLTQSSETYKVPIFLTKRDSGFEVAANKKSWNSLISVSSSIILAPESLVSEGLLQAYYDWETKEYEYISKGVEEILNG
jgi:hypothetical protein